MEFNRNHIVPMGEVAAWNAWFESVGITLITLWICFASNSEDPFYLKASFPWPIVGPLLGSIRYGFYHGLINALVVLFSIQIYLITGEETTASYPYTYAVGILSVTMLVGEFRDIWGRSLNRLNEANNYRQLRLDEFTRNFHLLKVSHDRLEQRLVGSAFSLREALVNLHKAMGGQKETTKENQNEITAPFANKVLSLFAEYGSLHQAALHLVTPDGITKEPLALLGDQLEFEEQDSMLKECLRSHRLVSIQPDFVGTGKVKSSKLLACIPLVDSNNQVRAIVLVHAMPFFAFHESTLKLLILMAGHMADLLSSQAQVGYIANAELSHLSLNLKRSLSDCTDHQLPASIILMKTKSQLEIERISATVQSIRRGLDIIYSQSIADKEFVTLVLLPLTDPLGAEGYTARMDEAFKNTAGINLSQTEIELQRHSLESQQGLHKFITGALGDEHPLADHTSSNT